MPPSQSRPGTCCAWPLVGRGGRPRALLRSLATLLGVEIGIPDHTTFARRSPGLALASSLAQAQACGPVHVVIDATGLKVHGAGEWLAETQGERGRRSWRKLHLAVDPDSGEILASELTTTEERDAALVGPLLNWSVPCSSRSPAPSPRSRPMGRTTASPCTAPFPRASPTRPRP
jgi:Transposase DDE domain